MDNKTNIQDKALKLFASRGYHSVGVQEIVTTAQITKPTLYHYFGSKAGLLESIFHNYYSLFENQFNIIVMSKNDIELNVRKIVSAFFTFAEKNRDFYRMQLSMYFIPPENEVNELLKPFNEKIFHTVNNLLTKTLDIKNNKEISLYTLHLFGIVNNLIGLYLNDYIILNDELIDKTTKFFLNGIG